MPSDPAPSPELSFADRRLIELLREGVPDAEISVRIGISVGEVKDRIERLQRRLGVPDRAGLLAWRPPFARPLPGAESRPEPGRPAVPAPAAGPVAPARSRLPFLAALAGVAVVVALVTAVAVLLFFASEAERPAAGSSPTTVAASPTPAGGETPGPTAADPDVRVVAGVEFRRATYLPAVPFPTNTAMLVATGCWQCDGPTESIQRLWRGEGEVHVTTVFEPSEVAAVDGAVLLSWGQYERRIVVGVCTKPGCAWLDRSSPGSEFTFYQSLDRGASWTALGTAPGDSWLLAVGPNDILLTRTVGEGQGSRALVVEWPSMEPARVPVDGRWPVAFWARNGWAWTSENGGLFFEGEYIPWLDGKAIATVLPDGMGGFVLVFANRATTGLEGTFMARVPDLRTAPTSGTWEPERYVRIGAEMIGPGLTGRWVGNAEFPAELLPVGSQPWRPAIIGLSGGVITPITGPFKGGRDFVLAAWEGSFVEVNTPDDCLNVRESPSTNAPIIECVPDRMLLTRRGGGAAQDDEGAFWIGVYLTPKGVPGWARADYLLE